MTITEPAVAITDWLLGLLCWTLAAMLARRADGWARRAWVVGLVCAGFAASLAGVHHGLRASMSRQASLRFWHGSMLAVFGLSASLLIAEGLSLFGRGRLRRAVVAFAVIELCVVVVGSWRTLDYRWALADYAPVLLAALAAEIVVWRRQRSPASPWFIAGVVVVIGGTIVQMAGAALPVDANAAYRLMTMAGFALLYQGARRVHDGRLVAPR